MPKKIEQYTEGIGRRKSSVARVRLLAGGKGSITINADRSLAGGKTLAEYFVTEEMQKIAARPIDLVPKTIKTGGFSIHVSGGGIHSQAEAVAHGIARALALANPELKKPLKDARHLTRDARAKERRKFGLKKARKAPQWSKR